MFNPDPNTSAKCEISVHYVLCVESVRIKLSAAFYFADSFDRYAARLQRSTPIVFVLCDVWVSAFTRIKRIDDFTEIFADASAQRPVSVMGQYLRAIVQHRARTLGHSSPVRSSSSRSSVRRTRQSAALPVRTASVFQIIIKRLESSRRVINTVFVH